MSRTDRTAPAWVQEARADIFTARHWCVDHGQTGRMFHPSEACDLPTHWPDRRDEINWRPRTRCVWEALLPYADERRSTRRHSHRLKRDHRLYWGTQRAAWRGEARSLARDHNAGNDVEHSGPRVGRHRHSIRWHNVD